MADNTLLNLATSAGGDTVRTLADATAIKWPVNTVAYATSVSPGANVVQVVTPSAGLPVTQAQPAALASAWPMKVSDGVNIVALYQTHNTDNQTLGGTAYALNTGGVAQLLNASGSIDRQRETGLDGVPATGIATGAQQFAVPFSTTIASSFAAGAQTVTPASMSGIQVGSILKVANSNGSNSEVVYVSATAASTFTATFALSKTGPGITVQGFTYNQARDASIGDNQALIGLSASATYLYNAVTGLAELDRSVNGELDGASGKGTAVAAEYEYNGGGPLTNAGTPSGLSYDRARNLQGKGVGVATQSAGGAAGTSSITVSSAAATNSLWAGQQIRIDRNTATEECAYVATSYVPGTAAIALQTPLQYSHTTATVEWDVFSSTGPGLSGFTPAGIGIEEEALYNPVDGKYYIERSATLDAMPGANIVAECPALWNGATFDRLKGASANPTTATGVAVVANGIAPLSSFSAQSAVNTTGSALDNGVARANHSLWVVAGAGVSGGVVTLMGSNDGVNYFATSCTVTTSSASTAYAANLANFPFRYVLAKITTAITGGTVSASVASC
jgi:hypothetical protein